MVWRSYIFGSGREFRYIADTFTLESGEMASICRR
jgi:hypothetical protein